MKILIWLTSKTKIKKTNCHLNILDKIMILFIMNNHISKQVIYPQLDKIIFKQNKINQGDLH